MQTTSPYKTAAELGIEQWEHDGLVALIGPLSRGELDLDMTYPTGPRDIDSDWDDPASLCGTCHCIGGWIAFRHGLKDRYSIGKYVHDVDRLRTKLRPLFFPGHHALIWATAPQAARAIVNFLTLGDPKWDDVMREPASALEALNAILVADFDEDDSGCVEHVIERETA